jgi:hypothetical protein
MIKHKMVYTISMIQLKVLENKLHSKMNAFAEIVRDKVSDLADAASNTPIFGLTSGGAIMMVAGFVVSASEFCVYRLSGNSAALQNSNLATGVGLVGLALYLRGRSFGGLEMEESEIGSSFHKKPASS